MYTFDHKELISKLKSLPKESLLALAKVLRLRAYVSKDKRFMDFFWVTGKDGKPKAKRGTHTDVVHGISTYFHNGKGDTNYWIYESFSHFPLVTYGSGITHRKIKLEQVEKNALAYAILDALETVYLAGWFGKLDPLEQTMYLAGLRKDPPTPRDC